jgi:hypothetical protein
MKSWSTCEALGAGTSRTPRFPPPAPHLPSPQAILPFEETQKQHEQQATTVPAALILSREGESPRRPRASSRCHLVRRNVERKPERSALADRDDRTNYFRARPCGGKPSAGRSSPR